MSSPVRPGTATARRKVLTLNEKRTILDDAQQNIKKTVIALKYDITQSNLATVTKDSNKIDAILDSDVGSGERK